MVAAPINWSVLLRTLKRLSDNVILSEAKNLVFNISIEILQSFHSFRMTKRIFLGVIAQTLKDAATKS